MSKEKILKNRIRGWIPKEPSRPNIQDAQIPSFKAKPEKQGAKKIGQITYATLLVGGVLIGIFSATGLGLYAAVIIGVAIALVIAVASRHLNPRQQGSKEVMNAGQRRVINSILIVNVTILGVYLAAYVGVLSIISNAEIELVVMIALFAVWFLVNRLLFKNLRKQATTSTERKV